MILAWDDLPTSGIEEIDSQHKEFIKIMKRIQILKEKGSGKDLVSPLLHELLKYTEYHFISEENLMLVTRYPAIENHRMEHKKLLRALGYRIRGFEEDDETLADLLDFLGTWLLDHTRNEDAKIGTFISSRAAN